MNKNNALRRSPMLHSTIIFFSNFNEATYILKQPPYDRMNIKHEMSKHIICKTIFTSARLL